MRLTRAAARALLLMILPVGLVVSAGLPAAASPKDPRLVTRLNAVLADKRVQKARTSVAVIDGRDGTQLYNRYATRPTTPASNTKIVTAIAAMHTLGPGFRFKTQVIRRGPVVNGVVQGRLYLKGYGDPTTRVADYASLARQVKAAGIKRFTGPLVVDSSYFDAQRYNPHWSRTYASDGYAAQITGLTEAPNADLDSGTIFVYYQPGRKGARAKITTAPAAAKAYVKIINKTVTRSYGADTVRVHRAWGTNQITVSGYARTGRAQSSRQVTVDRPDLLAGAIMRSELAKLGITTTGGTISAVTPATSRHVIGQDTSMTLAALLRPFLKLSNNMHAEALTKAMAAQRTHQPGSWAVGLGYTRAYLRSLGTPMSGIVLVDGSGLTRSNKLTPRALTTVLWKVRSEPWFASFYAALPIAGVNSHLTGGTLRHRMNGTLAAGNAHAKTGTLTGVTALSGYVRGRNGRLYVFSMLSQYSGSTPRPVEDKLVVALADWPG